MRALDGCRSAASRNGPTASAGRPSFRNWVARASNGVSAAGWSCVGLRHDAETWVGDRNRRRNFHRNHEPAAMTVSYGLPPCDDRGRSGRHCGPRQGKAEAIQRRVGRTQAFPGRGRGRRRASSPRRRLANDCDGDPLIRRSARRRPPRSVAEEARERLDDEGPPWLAYSLRSSRVEAAPSAPAAARPFSLELQGNGVKMKELDRRARAVVPQHDREVALDVWLAGKVEDRRVSAVRPRATVRTRLHGEQRPRGLGEGVRNRVALGEEVGDRSVERGGVIQISLSAASAPNVTVCPLETPAPNSGVERSEPKAPVPLIRPTSSS